MGFPNIHTHTHAHTHTQCTHTHTHTHTHINFIKFMKKICVNKYTHTQQWQLHKILTISLNLNMYLDLPLLSFTSFEKRRQPSKRKSRRSRPLRMICLGSHTVKVSCSRTSPRASRLSSRPSSMDRCMASLAFLGTFIITSRPSCKNTCIYVRIDR